ncbi:aminopeptidase N-like [Uranotaenia lowii]|uniref:aminopeptidase N-like n=1 Tax=Uranotaenia lowii TaxID=190385 RepID=UPI00247B0661|nr:aminopeptidase N-like [Uranotaenia lowii]
MSRKFRFGLFLILCMPLAGECWDSFRLPNTTRPTHYDLLIETGIHAGVLDYNGTVKISIKILETTNQIVLHSTRSTLIDVDLKNDNELPIPIWKHEFDNEKDFLVITTVNELDKGASVQLEISFTNSIDRTDQSGFYRTSYSNEEGVVKNAGVTQFQACEARSSFPCYDEPGIKTTFDVRITCGLDYHARSNADISAVTIISKEKKLVTFKRTPPMQTYLLAFLVSDFSVERDFANATKKITVQSMVRASQTSKLSYSVDASIKLINELQSYFDHPFEMNKIDSVGIRDADFAAGAMENWGLVTYRESLFLATESSSNTVKRDVASTIAHEFAHQFFGNLMAPSWWSYLWLNEGFATLYEYYLTDRTHPELLTKDRFPAVALQTALNADGSATVRPMTHYVETVPEIDRLFDRIAYDKSGSVLRMLQYALGESTFVKGLQYYIKENQNSVVEPRNLYKSLQKAVDEDNVLPESASISDILDSWSRQPGAPVVTVVRSDDNNYVLFKQARYFSVAQPTENEQTWWIPIFSSSGEDEKTPAFWIPQSQREMNVSLQLQSDDPLVINPTRTGYYRVNYDQQNWDLIVETIDSNASYFSPTTVAMLIDDSMNLAHAGYLEHNTSFLIMDQLRKNSDYLPWKAAHQNILLLEKMLATELNAKDLLRRYVLQLTENLLEIYGLEERKGENVNDHDIRLIAIDLTCRMGQTTCTEHAEDKLRILQPRAGLFSIRSDTQQRWYCNGLRAARQVQWDIFKQSLQSEQDSVGRQYLLDSLACVRDRAVLGHVLDYLTGSSSSNQEILRFLGTAAEQGAIGLDLALDYLSSQHDEFDNQLDTRRGVEKLLVKLADSIVDRTRAKHFLQLVRLYLGATEFEKILATKLDEQIQWKETNAELVRDTLERFIL